MRCPQCQTELPTAARFCLSCGQAVPASAGIQVDQQVGTLKGEAVGTVIGDLTSALGLSSSTKQQVDKVEDGGTLVGTVIGGGDTTQIGGQHYHGGYVGGDQISVGDISGSSGVAIGGNAQATVTTGLSGADLDRLFQPLLAAIGGAPPAQQARATAAAAELKSELAKGKQAEDSRVAKLLDGLVDLVPGAVSSVVSLFTSPILAGVAGPVTKFVLDKIQGK